MRGDLVWYICAFVPSKAGLTKEVVLQKRHCYCTSNDLCPLQGTSLSKFCCRYGKDLMHNLSDSEACMHCWVTPHVIDC